MGQIDFKIGTPKEIAESRLLEERAKSSQPTRIFIAEPHKYWQDIYRKEIGGIIGQNNLVMAADYEQSRKILASSPPFSAYVIEPKMHDGFGLAESIRQMEENSHTVVIVSSDNGLAGKAREIGFKHVVEKNYEKPELSIKEIKKELGF